jgi:hypothetical protein
VDNEKTVRVNLPLLAMTLPPELRRMITASVASAAAGVLAGGAAAAAPASRASLEVAPGPQL